MAFLQINNVSKLFGTTEAVKEFNLDIEKGELVRNNIAILIIAHFFFDYYVWIRCKFDQYIAASGIFNLDSACA